ncbi:MAG: hypothetical protein HKN51_07340 [Saprospiraceae bacterium]|nr:hypothetical protein [Saprospiraceae bacterium]
MINKTSNKLNLILYIILSCPYFIMAQSILLNEDHSDWENVDLVSSDFDDGQFIDIRELKIANDDNYLFLRFSFDQEIILQDENDITLYLDIDNEITTGNSFNGMGADIIFNFGQKRGNFYGNQIFSIFHNDIGLISSPTVSSTEFEIGIKRQFDFTNLSMANDIKLFIRTSSFLGDYIPNEDEPASYQMKDNIPSFAGDYNIFPDPNADFRVMSYNVLRDQIFEPESKDAYSRILSTVKPDIFCFQEIYDHNATSLLNYLEDLDVINTIQEEWYAIKDGRDLITLSKYPIKFHREVFGNSFLVADVDGQDLIIINCHLPCCDNNNGREEEIDAILSFLRNGLEGNAPYPIISGTPYMILGDMNFVGFASQVESLLTGNIDDNYRFGDDVILDWDDGLMTDVKPQTTGFPATFTWYNPFGSFSAGRLDYCIYTDATMEATNSYVLNTNGLSQSEIQETGLEIDDVNQASDHLPLIMDFKLLQTSTIDFSDEITIELSPNPFKDYLNIKSDNDVYSIQLIDNNGKIVFFKSLGAHLGKEINIQVTNHLKSGSYTAIIHTKNGYSSKPLIVVN